MVIPLMVALVALVPCWGAAAVELRLLTAEARPLSYPDGSGGAAGWTVEVVKEIQRRLDSSVPVTFLPWPRAYYIAQHEPNVAVFSVLRTPKREEMFQWVGPLQTFKLGFYAAAFSPIRIDSLDDARRARSVGVTNLFAPDVELTRLGFTNLDRSATPEQMLRKLLAGHTALIACDDNLIRATQLQDYGIDINDLRLVYPIATLSSYIAFSKGTPATVVQAWQRALDEMVADGSFARLAARID